MRQTGVFLWAFRTWSCRCQMGSDNQQMTDGWILVASYNRYHMSIFRHVLNLELFMLYSSRFIRKTKTSSYAQTDGGDFKGSRAKFYSSTACTSTKLKIILRHQNIILGWQGKDIIKIEEARVRGERKQVNVCIIYGLPSHSRYRMTKAVFMWRKNIIPCHISTINSTLILSDDME